MTDLLPCPFCGREAENDLRQAYRSMQTGSIDYGAAVYCTGCNANMIMCRADHPELSDEERMATMFEDWNRRAPSPTPHAPSVQALLHSLNRAAIAKIIDPSAWINEDGHEIEQEHSGTSLHAADQIITYVLRTARALATRKDSVDDLPYICDACTSGAVSGCQCQPSPPSQDVEALSPQAHLRVTKPDTIAQFVAALADHGVKLPLLETDEDVGTLVDADGKPVLVVDVDRDRSDEDVAWIVGMIQVAVNTCGGFKAQRTATTEGLPDAD